MNRDDVIRMAWQAGLAIVDKHILADNENGPEHVICTEAINRFAALVAAEIGIETHRRGYESGLRDGAIAEREACAKVADSISEDQWSLYKGKPPYTGKELERASDYTQGKSDGAEVCAATIRARGQA